MPTLDEINAKLQQLDGFERIVGRREIKALPEILDDAEMLVAAVQGTYDSAIGLLAATNSRMIFIDVGILWGRKVHDFPHASVSSIEYKTGLLFGSIQFTASAAKAEIKDVAKDRVKAFVDLVRPFVGTKAGSIGAGDVASGDMADTLSRLVDLHNAGSLTDEEFTAAKRKALY